jgi:hypothetical protein
MGDGDTLTWTHAHDMHVTDVMIIFPKDGGYIWTDFILIQDYLHTTLPLIKGALFGYNDLGADRNLEVNYRLGLT